MQITTVTVHNFRSLVDVSFNLYDYTFLVGANNSGKTNAIDALRVFYEKDIRYSFKDDDPKAGASDDESWIDIEYSLTRDEFEALKDDYKSGNYRLKVRKYLRAKAKGPDGKAKQGIYAYKSDGTIADEHFYGAKNVQQGKLGEVVYIPAVSKLDEHMKTSGPSALRDIINGIVGNLVKTSETFTTLISDFSKHMNELMAEETDEGHSIGGLENDINAEIEEWQAGFQIKINPFTETEIVKNLVTFSISDTTLLDEVSSDRFGQGFQRHLIYTLLKLTAKYQAGAQSTDNKKEFRPNLTLLLFEEPEVFLHPTQQHVLCQSLRAIGSKEGNQVILSTHSSQFVSNNSDDLCAIVRLNRKLGKTEIGQIAPSQLDRIFQENQQINNMVPKIDTDDMLLDMEAVKYFLWLDPHRCGMFFAGHVLLVEGPTETAFINYLVKSDRINVPIGGLFVLDCFGKYNMHRFMNLLGELKAVHSVLYDDDNGRPPHDQLATLIHDSANSYTHKIQPISGDIETFLNIDKAKDKRRKPQHLLLRNGQGKIPKTNLTQYINLVNQTIN